MDRARLDGLRKAAGWLAVGLSTLLLSMWAFWGAAEAFHEGWFSRSVWENLALTLVQYLSPWLLCTVPVVLALRWPRVGMVLFLLLAAGAFLLFRHGAGVTMIAIPLVCLGALFRWGIAEPRRWAYRTVFVIPLLTALATGVVPGYRAMTRLDDGNYGARLVEGNGVRLVWAPEGPGWGEHYTPWEEAMRRCAHLTADGSAIRVERVGVWRLPTVEEAVGSMVRHGKNAGGTWDARTRKPSYRTQPEKESPLWRRYSQVIYWWTATEDGPEKAQRIAFNGYVLSIRKRGWGDYLAYRCVCEPERFAGTAKP